LAYFAVGGSFAGIPSLYGSDADINQARRQLKHLELKSPGGDSGNFIF